MSWITVRNADTGGLANVNPDAVEQLQGLGWEPVGEPTEEKRPLVGDALNGLLPEPVGEPADAGIPPEADSAPATPSKPTSKKAGSGPAAKENTDGE